MKRLLIILCVLLCPLGALAKLGGSPMGAACSADDDIPGESSSECFTGLLCFYNHSAKEGFCMPDCTYLDNKNMSVTLVNVLNLSANAAGIIGTQCAECASYQECPQISHRYYCTINQYGMPTDEQTGCTACPLGGISSTPGDLKGGKYITDCYLSAREEPYTDETGEFVLTDKCYWTE